MSELIDRMMGDGYWADALPYPAVAQLAAEREDGAYADSVIDNYNIIYGYADGTHVDYVLPGQAFPDLDGERPLMGVVVDAHIAGPERFVEALLAENPGLAAVTAEQFQGVADSIVDNVGYYGKAVQWAV